MPFRDFFEDGFQEFKPLSYSVGPVEINDGLSGVPDFTTFASTCTLEVGN